MAKLQDKIQTDMKEAMKGKIAIKLSTLRMLLAAVKNKQIELKTDDLKEEEFIAVLKSEIKKRQDSIESYRAGSRDDLVNKEEKEKEILEAYMPEQLGEEEISRAVEEVISEFGEKAKLGAVMGKVMAKLKGQADGNIVRDIVNKKLQR